MQTDGCNQEGISHTLHHPNTDNEATYVPTPATRADWGMETFHPYFSSLNRRVRKSVLPVRYCWACPMVNGP